MTLHLGDWRNALGGDTSFDCIITDPPYSARTHKGHNAASKKTNRRELDYKHLSPKDVREFVAAMGPRCNGWFCVMTSHDLIPHWEHAFRKLDRYVFKPIPIVIPGMTCRMNGDGPSNWSVDLVVSRPRHAPYSKWGTLRGAYLNLSGQKNKRLRAGGKPLWVMQQIIRDYSKTGDLVCDPFAGFGTTALACKKENRKFIGCEVDPKIYAQAIKYVWG